MGEILQRSPELYGLGRSRWWLDGLRQTVAWLEKCSLSGIWQILQRLGLRYKRGRTYVHSPDLEYQSKLDLIAQALHQAQSAPQEVVLLYEDEFTYYRRASVARAWGQTGQDDVRANSGWHFNTKRRLAGALNVLTGQFFAWQRSCFAHKTLLSFFLALEQAYPHARTIFVALDNWPVHFHPALLQRLATSRIVLLRLPTYAPWTNPVEKVWRKLFQDVLHLHRFADDWNALQQRVQHWLDQLVLPSPELLHYVGL